MTSPRVAGLGYGDWAVVLESAVEHDHFVAVVDVHSSMSEVSTKQTSSNFRFIACIHEIHTSFTIIILTN